jgi:hypothetical protein
MPSHAVGLPWKTRSSQHEAIKEGAPLLPRCCAAICASSSGRAFQTILPGTPYLPNWHIDAIVHHVMQVHAGDISRLIINQPPRSLKSICVSVAYVAWLLGHDPTRRPDRSATQGDLCHEASALRLPG